MTPAPPSTGRKTMTDDLVKRLRIAESDGRVAHPSEAADRIEALEARAEKAEAERDAAIAALSEEGRRRGEAEAKRDALREALKVTSAILQAEMCRSGGEPFSGTWTIPPLQIRATCHEALDQANAALNREAGT